MHSSCQAPQSGRPAFRPSPAFRDEPLEGAPRISTVFFKRTPNGIQCLP